MPVGTKTILLPLLTTLAILGAIPGETAAQRPAFPVKDINTSTSGSDPGRLVARGSTLFFSARAAATGRELFKSDGTESGTSIAVDIYPGPDSSSPEHVTAFDGSIVFVTTDSEERARLWRTNGTERGAVVVSELPGGLVRSLTVVDELLFFTVGFCGDKLWTSDGSETGTLLVKQFTPIGPPSSVCLGLPTAVAQTLFFVVQDGYKSRTLWKSDGTEEGTMLLGDFGVGSTPYGLDGLTSVDGVLFFVAGEREDRPQLWKSDGTADGTILVKEWPRGQPAARELTAVGGVLFFIADDGRHGAELWKSDGTPDGTVLVRDIRSGTTGSNPHDLRDVNGRLVFSANDGVHGNEPWKSDGTEARTRLLVDTSVASDGSSPSDFTVTSRGLFFVFRRGFRDELWHSDRTTTGTHLLKACATSLRGENYLPSIALENLFGAGGVLFFTVDDPSTGRELWTSDGTSEGTRLVADLNVATNGATPDNLVAAGGAAYFTAYVAPGHQTLWKSDGSAEGTVMIKDGGQLRMPSITRPPPTPPFDYLTVVNGIVFLTVRDSLHGTELWRTDGTEAGTRLVRDIVPGHDSSRPVLLTDVGDRLVFLASGHEVWSSDGTEAYTSRLWSPEDEPESGTPIDVTALEAAGGRAFFVTAGSELPPALWTTDGTAEGTELITRLGTSAQASYYGFTSVGDGVFFSGATTTVESLWRTDGTAPGTVIVRDFPAPNGPVVWTGLCDAGGLLMFGVEDEHGSELWRSDGTAAGTALVKDINPGRAGSLPRWLTCVGGVVFFTADDGVTGEELWKSDGTEAGTQLVKDLEPGPQWSSPLRLMQVDGHLVFRACDAAGCEVWASDGTERGTHIVADIAPGAGSSDPGPFVDAGSQLFFAATDDLHDRELWALPSAAIRLRSFDCDGDGSVTIRDLIRMVNGALSNDAPTGCPSGDRNADGRITIDEIVAAVGEVITA